MSAAPLHCLALCDARIALRDTRGAHFEEPGVALLTEGGAHFGHAALSLARRTPRALCDRVWSAPSAVAPRAGARHADLAHAQLRALWQRVAEPDAPALLIVPANYHARGELGVLLGIAHAAGLRVRALLEAPLAASTRRWPGHARAHLEFDEHDCVLTWLEAGAQLRRGACRVLEGHGLRQTRDALFGFAANALLALPERFDAFGSAASEQAVHDALFAKGFGAPASVLRVSHDGRTFEVPLAASEQEAALAPLVAAVCAFVAREFSQHAHAGQPLGIELGAQAAAVPGLARALEARAGAQVRTLARGAELEGAYARAAHIPVRSEVRLLTALPFLDAPHLDEAHVETHSDEPHASADRA